MRFSLFLAGVTAFFASSAAAKHLTTRTSAAAPATGENGADVYASLQARFDPASGEIRSRSGPLRHEKRTAGAYVRTQAHGYLSSAYNDLQAHAQAIEDAVDGMAGVRRPDYNGVAATINVHLGAINAILGVTIGNVKGCGGGSRPSQSPSNPPSWWDLCWILWLICSLLHSCCLKVILSCGSSTIIKAACTVAINTCASQLAQCLSVTDSIVGGGLLATVGSLAGGILGSLGSIGYGFGGVAGLFH